MGRLKGKEEPVEHTLQAVAGGPEHMLRDRAQAGGKPHSLMLQDGRCVCPDASCRC